MRAASEADARAVAAEARAEAAEARATEWEQKAAGGRDAEALLQAAEARAAAAEALAREWEQKASEGRQTAEQVEEALRTATGRFSQVDGKARVLAAKVEEQQKLTKEQRALILEAKSTLERLDKDNQRLNRLVGDARARGRVNVEELLQRAELLKRLERMAAVTGD
jgi:hypothetical protein